MSALVSPLKGTTKEVREVSIWLIDRLNAEEAQTLHYDFLGRQNHGKKAEVIDALANYLIGPGLNAAFAKLDPLEQKAVAEAVHSAQGYDPVRFEAQHSKPAPRIGRYAKHIRPRSPLQLFLDFDHSVCAYRAPAPFERRLKAFVPKPKQPKLDVTQNLPEVYERKTKSYRLQDDDPGRTVLMRGSVYQVPTKQPHESVEIDSIPVETANRAEQAQKEVWSVIRLIQQGKVDVAEKSSQPSTDTAWSVAQSFGGDYFQSLAPEEFSEIGCIRGFAWIMLLQGAGLAKQQGKKLALTKPGLQGLSQNPTQLIASMWQAWQSSDFFDEFRRIDNIKGQAGKAKRAFSEPSTRRQQITKTLKECPSQEWVSIKEFSRYMRACGNTFEVTYDPWSLYIANSNYGSLGYRDSHTWNILQERYMSCFLFEYVATLGLIDIAFIPPWMAENDYKHMWGSDRIPFLSRYDGLLHFRINELGDYCLQRKAGYCGKRKDAATLSVMPNLRIKLSSGTLSVAESLLLESFAESIGENTWELSQEKSILACESGQKVGALRDLLSAKDDQELPQQVETFLSKVEKQATAVHPVGSALLFDCFNPDIAAEIAAHPLTKKLCQLTSVNQLVVKTSDETKFRKALHAIGYGTAAGS